MVHKKKMTKYKRQTLDPSHIYEIIPMFNKLNAFYMIIFGTHDIGAQFENLIYAKFNLRSANILILAICSICWQ